MKADLKMKGHYILVDWLWNRMSFLKRKKVKFSVDLQVCNLSDVPLVNAYLFAKVRLLDGGNFEDQTERAEVVAHNVSWSHRSAFSCRITSDPSTGMLEKCLCRISIRKEQRGGKSYAKLGYVDINLAEFAASGVEGIARSYLLDGYGTNSRQDNSKVLVKVTMCHQSADPFFRVPQIAGIMEDKALNPVDRRAPAPEATAAEDEEKLVTYRSAMAETPEESPYLSNIRRVSRQSASTVGSTGVAEDAVSLVSDTKRSTASTATALRRLSQDRSSAPRIQSTRIDAGCVIDRMLAESRLSEADDPHTDETDGLALYLDRDGMPTVSSHKPAGFQKVTLADGT